jgi:hypothetical protein
VVKVSICCLDQLEGFSIHCLEGPIQELMQWHSVFCDSMVGDRHTVELPIEADGGRKMLLHLGNVLDALRSLQ